MQTTLLSLIASLIALTSTLTGYLNSNSTQNLAAVSAPISGLVGYWKFDDASGTTAIDSSGNSNNGSLTNGPTWQTSSSCKFGGCLSFDGVNDYVGLSNFTNEVLNRDGATNNSTLSLWVKSNGAVTGSRRILGRLDNAAILQEGSSFIFEVLNNDGSSFRVTYSPTTISNWIHLAIVYTGTNNGMNFYADGTLVGTNTHTKVLMYTDNNFYIGGNNNSAKSFSGSIDEVRIYNRALSAQEVSDIYNDNGGSPTPPSPTPSPTPSPSPTPVAPPVISSVSSSNITTTGASISWNTDTSSDSQVEYGLTTSYGFSSSINSSLVTTHSVSLSSLSSNTQYHYRVKSKDVSNNLSTSNDFTFITSATSITTPPPPPPPPPSPLPPPVAGSCTPGGNGVVIQDTTGSVQTSRPFTISRVFKDGDISQYPQARVNGNTVTTQADVKTRYASGYVKHVMISFITSLPANGCANIDFINQSTGNNSGELDRNGMLNYNSGSWGGTISTSIGSADAKTMLADTALALSTDSNSNQIRYWLRGPIVTQVIVEDKATTLKYDFGSVVAKPLHPIFLLTFYPNTNLGVQVEYILENDWSNKLGDQAYSLSLTAGPSGTVYSKSTFTHYARTKWHKIFWSGTKPAGWQDYATLGVKIDYNFPYLVASKALPNFNASRTSNSTGAGYTKDYDINGIGQVLQYMPQTGGREDIGIIPGWYGEYLQSMSPGMYAVMLGNAEIAGYIPVHMREADTTLKYDSANIVPAYGKSFSIDAHPTSWGVSGTTCSGCTQSFGSGWTWDIAHEPALSYVPYLITGDWYYLDNLYNYAALSVAVTDPSNVNWGRNGSWGILSWSIQTRGIAWGLRNIAEASFMSPDGSAEKAYFAQKINNNIAVREGNLNISNGSFYDPSASSMWTWGRNVFSNGKNPSLLGHPNWADEYASKEGMSSVTQYPDGPWQYGYLMISYGHLSELGFPIEKVKESFAKFYIDALQNPAFNPWMIAAYRIPVVQASTGQYFTTWADMKSGLSTSVVNSDCGGRIDNFQTLNSWPQCDEGSTSHSYPHIAKSAVSFTYPYSDGSLTGVGAWNWINSAAPSLPQIRWDIIPRTGGTPPPPSPVPLPPPAPLPPPPTPPSTTFSAGQRVQTVANLNVRATPSTSGTLLGTQPLGSLGTIVSGGTFADNFYWWNVNFDTGSDGYSVESYLTNYVAPPPPPPPVNVTPTVNAGADLTITLPSGASISGIASDDGLPTGSIITTTWSKFSGPGTVTFVNPGSRSTTATFSTSGTYTLRLTATDGLLSSFDDINITVNPALVVPPPAPQPLPPPPPPTGDITAPIITNVNTSKLGWTRVEVAWITNEISDSQVEYGLTTSYGSTSPLNSTLTTSHTISLSQLKSGTNYLFRVKSKDQSNNTGISANFNFTTKSRLPRPPKISFVTATEGSVKLAWQQVDYDDLCKNIEIYRNTTGFLNAPDNGARLITLSCDQIAFTDQSVSYSTTYYYTLFVVDDQNVYSDPLTIQFTTKSAPITPTPPTPPPPTPTPSPAPSPSPSTGGGSTPPPSPVPPISEIPKPPSEPIRDTVAPGSKGSDVTKLQTFLVSKGYLTPDNVTGYFGPTTQSAVQAFQRSLGIVTSGSPDTTGYGAVGPTTKAKINSLIIPTGSALQQSSGQASSPSGPQSSTLASNLSRGSKGTDVSKLQTFLVSKGYLTPDNVTGYFGPTTQSAVQAFQRSLGIVTSGSPDTTGYGAVGPTTKAKINSLIIPTGSALQQSSGQAGSPSAQSIQQQIEALQKQANELLLKLKTGN